jgi:nicotinamidase-related amidase
MADKPEMMAYGTSALLVIDLQIGMFDGASMPPLYNADRLVENTRALLAWARDRGHRVAFVQHSGPAGDMLAPDAPGWPILAALGRHDDEPVFGKTIDNAFSQPALGAWLDENGVGHVILAGAQTDECVEATLGGALDRGLEVTVVADAHSTWDGPGGTAPEIIARKNRAFSERGATVAETRATTAG